jgi:hypothetical protein
VRAKICYAVEVDDEFRRAIRHFYGERGLATRSEVKAWFEEYGHTQDMDLVEDMIAALEPEKP